MTTSAALPLVAPAGAAVNLSTFLTRQFGAIYDASAPVWVYYSGADALKAANFSYWNLATPLNTTVSGADGLIAPDQNVAVDHAATATIHVGNVIAPNLFIAVPFRSMDGHVGYDWMNYYSLDPSLVRDTAGAPTPADLLGSISAFALKYINVPNAFDCGWIVSQVAAAVGAALPFESESLSPPDNQSGGFWRVVYRGSDPNPVAHWQSLVQPGDFVRMQWADTGGPHTTMVYGVDTDGSLQVYDNSADSISIHRANYDRYTTPSSVTIFRLTPDHVYLVSGGATDDVLVGSPFHNEIHTGAGHDDVFGGKSSDVVYLDGAGAKTFQGGGGLDTIVLAGPTAQYHISVTQGDGQVTGAGISAALHGVGRLETADAYMAFDAAGAAGEGYRLYQAAFDRTPDQPGLSYWVHALDEGAALRDVAAGFVASAEFKAVYGAKPTAEQTIGLFYQHVLGRAGESAGLAYWTGLLNAGTAEADVLAGFSESPENVARLAPQMVHGISLDLAVFV